MSKHLRSIVEADKRLEGVKKSEVEDAEVYGGKDASVNVNDPSTVELTKKHKVEKHDSRAGNKGDVFSGDKQKNVLDDPRNARMKPAKDQYESVNEDKECNHTPPSVKCPKHGNSDCSGVTGKSKHLLIDKKEIKEATNDAPEESSMVRTELRAIVDKANAMLNALKKDKDIEPWVQAKIANAKGMLCGAHDYMMYGETNEEVEKEQINEVLTKKTSVSAIIHDFVHSDNPKFKGKSKKERQKMALGAYYSMHPEKSKKVQEDAAEPMLEGGKKKKKDCKETAGPDSPILPNNQIPNKTMNVKADTGYSI